MYILALSGKFQFCVRQSAQVDNLVIYFLRIYEEGVKKFVNVADHCEGWGIGNWIFGINFWNLLTTTFMYEGGMDDCGWRGKFFPNFCRRNKNMFQNMNSLTFYECMHVSSR